jgi:hypothetical protein
MTLCPHWLHILFQIIGTLWTLLGDGLQFLRLCLRFPTALAAENLFLRKQLALYQELSLSRLNHWLPGREAHPEVVEGTTDFHHDIADALFPEADPVFHNATALHTAVDMLDPEPATVEGLVGPLLLPCQLLSSWLLGRHEDFHVGQRERQEAQIL